MKHPRACRTRTILLGVFLMSLFKCQAAGDPVVRAPAVAGQFYDKNPASLKKEIEGYVADGMPLDAHPPIIISPHAGYVFSGPVAGKGFATVDPNAGKVILIGPSHHKHFDGVSIPEVDAYGLPLGTVPLAKKDIKKLRASKLVHAHRDAHSREHCLEVQIPFLQVVLSDFEIVPIITGKVDPAAVAELLYPLIDDKTLVVISSDFSHYHPHEQAKTIDSISIETVLTGDRSGPIDGCGELPIRVAMHLAGRMGLSPKLLDARNSSETCPQYGSGDRVVGYASIVYLKNGAEAGATSAAEKKPGDTMELSAADKAFFLKLARSALEKAVKGEPPPEPEEVPAVGKEVCGCFVTLTQDGNLRGCIGYIEGIKPLYQAVVDNARNAALSDPRFPRVTAGELESITVEVSVLTKPVPFSYDNPKDLLAKLEPGKDGIILRKGYSQSTFLPQVWDQLPDKVQFLEHLSRKAGLSGDAWKKAEYRRYYAIHFEEGE
ncbi:MAG: AmmeMemoRadiSam system protein B [Chitinivibrionales bacterium]|nr:AmmeMemoRadiSam system protein B [Chitinivibrionales bacterium]MBD3395183.1 AmmeMemoRadiSam system protein B [Chitinivibrionales bacterium]